MTDARDLGRENAAPGAAWPPIAPPRPDALDPEDSAWPHPEVLGSRNGPLAHLESWVVRAAIVALGLGPAALRRGAIGALARLGRVGFPRYSEAARRNLDQAFGAKLAPEERERIVLESWKTLLRTVLDSTSLQRRVPTESARDHFDLELGPGVATSLGERRGGVVITLHLGDWEAPRRLWPSLGFDPFYVIAKPTKNRPLSRWIQRTREASGTRILSRYGAMKDAGKVLTAGGSLGLLLDHRATQRPIFAPVFGRPAACERSSGVLLKRLRAPAYLSACLRTGDPSRYRLWIPKVLTPADISKQSSTELVHTINAEYERMIRRAPDQYYWLHDRYRGAPESLPPVEMQGEMQGEMRAKTPAETRASLDPPPRA